MANICGPGKELADLVSALGLDPGLVSGLRLDFGAEQICKAEVSMYLDVDQVGKLTEVVRRHHLTIGPEITPEPVGDDRMLMECGRIDIIDAPGRVLTSAEMGELMGPADARDREVIDEPVRVMSKAEWGRWPKGMNR